jgi:hypothetical protein
MKAQSMLLLRGSTPRSSVAGMTGMHKVRTRMTGYAVAFQFIQSISLFTTP